jgi:HrpA-like RNA helicase
VLQMYSLGLPDPRSFEFIEPPSAEKLEESIEFLKDQGALNFAEILTPLGKILANLPVDVGIGKILTMGCLFRQVEAVLTVAAAMSVQSPFVNQSSRDMDIVGLRQNLISDVGDPFTLLNVYKEWLEVKDEGENTRKWCKRRGT